MKFDDSKYEKNLIKIKELSLGDLIVFKSWNKFRFFYISNITKLKSKTEVSYFSLRRPAHIRKVKDTPETTFCVGVLYKTA